MALRVGPWHSARSTFTAELNLVEVAAINNLSKAMLDQENKKAQARKGKAAKCKVTLFNVRLPSGLLGPSESWCQA